MRCGVTFGLFCLLCQPMYGQDASQRYEQYQAEAELMNAPCMVCFDATLVETFEKTDQIAMSRMIGRRVVGSKGEVRVDVRVTRNDVASENESIQFEHFIRYSAKEYKKAVGLFGSGLTIFDLDKKVEEDGLQPIAPPGFNNPFLVAIGGDRYLTGFANQGFVRNLAIERLDNALSTKPKAASVKLFTFSKEIPWAPVTVRFANNPKKYDKVVPIGNNRFKYDESHLPNWADLKKPENYIKDWHLLTTIATEWVAMGDVGAVPSRVVSQTNSNREAKRKVDFEVHYFGYGFDPKPTEKLLDRRRFNESNIQEDFPIESILEQAELAKKQTQNRSAKNWKGR